MKKHRIRHFYYGVRERVNKIRIVINKIILRHSNIKPCEYCSAIFGVEEVHAMTQYPREKKKEQPILRLFYIENGRYPDINDTHTNPNRDLMLCKRCKEEYVDHWTEMWAEYRSSIGVF